MESAGAQRAVLVLPTESGLAVRGRAEAGPAGVRFVAEDTPLARAPGVARSIVHFVGRTRRPLIVDDARRDGRFLRDEHVRSSGTRSVLAVPLVRGSGPGGVLYLENDLAAGAFSSQRLALLDVLSGQIAIALDNARLYSGLKDSVQRISALAAQQRRFVPEQLLELLGKSSLVDVNLGDHSEREMSILFADIRSFTPLSERIGPQASFEFLNAFLRELGPVVRACGGFIDKYIGDAFLALFPARPDDALEAAVRLQRTVAAANARGGFMGHPVRIGIGAHLGRLVLGTIG